MPDDTVAASGAQFARDLRRIRVEQDLSIQDVHEETRISVDLIESFETHGLFEHRSFNQVYLRSFVQSYAKCIGVDAGEALDSLEAALSGQYGNQLAVKYLDATPATPPGGNADEAADADAESDPESDPAPEPAATPATAQAPAPGEPITPSGDAEGAGSFLPAGNERGVFIVLAIVVGLAAIWGVVFFTELSSPDAEPASEPVPPAADTASVPATQDTARAAADASAARATRPPIVLGDTLYFTLVAESAPIEGIRIRRDDDLRRPYWVEVGQAAVFPAQQEITIDPLSDDVALLLNGYPWAGAGPGEVTITRADARSFLDSIGAAPVELSVPTDTVNIPGTQPASPPASQ